MSECKPINEECEEHESEADEVGNQDHIEESPSPIHTTQNEEEK
jgi:hypothetical protein